MSEPTVKVTTRQMAVGQGGFMTTQIQISKGKNWDTDFSFVFDCGSINREHLRQSLETLDRDVIDILFISHLDADHVNCVDLLINSMASVEAVVLPCLDPLSMAAIVCGTLNQGGLTGDFQSFLRNPVAWFSQRGVKRVLFVSRDGNGDTAPPFVPDDKPSFERQPGASVRRADSARVSYTIQSNGAPLRPVSTKVGAIEVQTLSAASAIQIQLGVASTSLS